jgi:cytochrome P450
MTTLREHTPGSTPVYDPFDYRMHEDPYPTYAWLRENAPVYRNEERDFWALSRCADVESALSRSALFSIRNGISLEPELWDPQASKRILFHAMDPPEHGRYRRLASSAFTPNHVARLEGRIRNWPEPGSPGSATGTTSTSRRTTRPRSRTTSSARWSASRSGTGT